MQVDIWNGLFLIPFEYEDDIAPLAHPDFCLHIGINCCEKSLQIFTFMAFFRLLEREFELLFIENSGYCVQC